MQTPPNNDTPGDSGAPKASEAPFEVEDLTESLDGEQAQVLMVPEWLQALVWVKQQRAEGKLPN